MIEFIGSCFVAANQTKKNDITHKIAYSGCIEEMLSEAVKYGEVAQDSVTRMVKRYAMNYFYNYNASFIIF